MLFLYAKINRYNKNIKKLLYNIIEGDDIMTVIIDTQGLTKNQAIAKAYEIVFECKILKKNSNGYLIRYNNIEKTEYIRYKDMKIKLKSKQGCYLCI